MDTKLKADIAESEVTTELLKRDFRVLKPIGDRLSYDLAVYTGKKLLCIQVKSAWFDKKHNFYCVDVRRTKTNRRRMLRSRYRKTDFDYAILYIEELNVFYVVPVTVFNRFASTITLIEMDKRQRKPRSAAFRNRWELLSGGSFVRQRTNVLCQIR